MSIYEEIQKSIQRQRMVAESFFEHKNTLDLVKGLEEDIQKGKKAEVGETRVWNGKKYKKQANGEWIYTGESKVVEETKKVKGDVIDKPNTEIKHNGVTIQVRLLYDNDNKPFLTYHAPNVSKMYFKKKQKLLDLIDDYVNYPEPYTESALKIDINNPNDLSEQIQFWEGQLKSTREAISEIRRYGISPALREYSESAKNFEKAIIWAKAKKARLEKIIKPVK